ncbi:TMV resistance protein N [Vitis vinifera]|uniref:ADP-ribosyl cyclase/cyclic ADP-ribose hydrolase n=1 Tax=Vitis vinifera TaxID=29760 RepID=A0A438FJH6_VITVI|nr:TMV resistance protein N [Vitis vinifera]
MESNDVRMVGICGIGGIGKTTIAGYIYNQISWGFECSSFLEDAKKVYKKKGLPHLQKLLLNDIQKGENSKISNIHQGARVIQNSLYLRKALIVLDDVDDMDQLEFLVGNHAWYGKGSRIIITTRDKRCLTMLNVDYLYNVEGLDSNEALELFSRHAFQSNLPKEDFKILLNPVIYYCEGLPLALKVLGSLLCGKTKGEWTSELHKLEKEPEMKIHNVLKISFDGLDTTQQMILLDIACFFQGEDKDFASKIWDGYELYGEINIGVLLEKCLITISNNRLHMHGLIEKMCKKIVREQHPKDPSKWSRLWNQDDIYCAFVSEKIKRKMVHYKIFARLKKVFAKMKKLRLLKVYYSLGNEHKMSLPKDFEFPPNLNYLHWEGLVSLPSNFHGEKLVAINLKSSNIKELLKGEKCLAELKFIDLSNSQQLIKIPKFSRMPKLEKLNLVGCVSFSQLHSSIGTFSEMNYLTELNFSESGIRELPITIGSLIALETLNLSKCSKFEKFPDTFFVNMRRLKVLGLSHSGIKELPTSIECLEALELLVLRNCSNFEKFPEIQKNMVNLLQLNLDYSGIKELPCLIGHLPRLQSLGLRKCKNLRSVPSSILQLESLKACFLEGCSNLEIFPEIMEDMEHSKGLSLLESAITELPSSIERQICAARLFLSDCENLETLPNNIGMTCVSHLVVRNCPKLHKLPDSLRSMQLKELDVSGCNLMAGAIPDDLWCLFSLEELNVSGNNIDCIPGGIISLSRLRSLKMNRCLMLTEIPELPSSLRRIEAYGCPLLETLSSDAKHPLWSSLPNGLKSDIQDYFECPPYWKYYRETRVVIPGSRGIPEWISHKSMGDEITIDLPKNWYEDNNFLGFALFSHHVPVDDICKTLCDDDIPYFPIVAFDTTLHLLISDGDQFGHVKVIDYTLECTRDMKNNTLFADPGLMVVYFPQIVISSEYRSNRWNKFKAGFSSVFKQAYRRASCKVESCGIHLIYDHGQDHPQQSLQLFNVKRSHDDTEDHPHV